MKLGKLTFSNGVNMSKTRVAQTYENLNVYCSLGSFVAGFDTRSPLFQNDRSKDSASDAADDQDVLLPKRRNTARVKRRKPTRRDRHAMLARFNRDPGISVYSSR